MPYGHVLTREHIEALRVITCATNSEPALSWGLTGSTSFALQGMDLVANDIDIMTDANDAYELARRLDTFVTRPIEYSSTDRIRSHFGQLRICGVDVEIMGDVQKKLPNGEWEPSFELPPLIRHVTYEGLRLPVIELAHEARAYRILGRDERADGIEAFLKIRSR